MKKNVPVGERVVSLALASFAIGRGMRSKSGLSGFAKLVAGGLLAVRGVSGYCSFYNALGLTAAPKRQRSKVERINEVRVKLRRTLAMRTSRDEAFAFLSNGQNLRQLVQGIEHLRPSGEGNTQWTVDLPMAGHVTFDVVMGQSKAPSEITFHSKDSAKTAKSKAGADGSMLTYEGRIILRDSLRHPSRSVKSSKTQGEVAGTGAAKAGQNEAQSTETSAGCLVTIEINLKPGKGILTAAVATALAPIGEEILSEGLRRLKQQLEAGELASITGQPRGPQVTIGSTLGDELAAAGAVSASFLEDDLLPAAEERAQLNLTQAERELADESFANLEVSLNSEDAGLLQDDLGPGLSVADAEFAGVVAKPDEGEQSIQTAASSTSQEELSGVGVAPGSDVEPGVDATVLNNGLNQTSSQDQQNRDPNKRPKKAKQSGRAS